MRRGSDGTSQRTRPGAWLRAATGTVTRVRHPSRGAAGLVALLVVLSACSGGGSDSNGTAASTTSRASTTTKPAGPAPGTRFDGAELPAPISNLVAIDDDLVAYYAPDADQDLEVVVVDPVAGKVRWDHEVAIPSRGSGDPLDLGLVHGVLPVFTRNGDDEVPYALVLLEPDGTTRSTTPIRRPLEFPLACGDRICAETVSGPVAVSPETGEVEVGEEPPWEPIGTSDAQILQLDSAAISQGGDQLIGRPQFGLEPTWQRATSELFGFEDVEMGWGTIHDDLWIAHGVPRPERRGPVTYPRREEPGTMAGFATADGAPRWRRDGISPCFLPVSADVVPSCGLVETQASEDADAESRLVAVASLDPETGQDRIRVDTLPYDSEEGDRVAVVGPDRLAVRTPSGIQEVDLRTGTAKPTDAHRVAWCRPNGHLPEVRDDSGHPVEYSSASQGRPCTVDASPATEDQLVAPIIDGSLPPVTEMSVVQVGPWVLWARDGHLEGVATNP